MELVISIILLSIIVLGAGTLSLSSRKFLQASERKTKALNELTFILDHVNKYSKIVTGNAAVAANSGIQCDAANLRLRVALTAIGVPDTTPDNNGDDLWVGYWIAGNSVTFCRNANALTLATLNTCLAANREVLSTNVEQGAFGCPAAPNGLVLQDNQFAVLNLQVMHNVTIGYHPLSNPRAIMNPHDMIFTSLNHSDI